MDPTQVVHYTNRAAAYLRLKQWRYAAIDATSALDLGKAAGGWHLRTDLSMPVYATCNDENVLIVCCQAYAVLQPHLPSTVLLLLAFVAVLTVQELLMVIP